MIQYKFEYTKRVENAEWKDQLGLDNTSRMSFFLKHRRLFYDHHSKPLIVAFSIASLLLMLQIFIRLSTSNDPLSPIYEQAWIWSISVLEFSVMIYIGHKIRGLYDIYNFRSQYISIFRICIIALFIWLSGIIIWTFFGYTNIDYLWLHIGCLLFWSSLFASLCYIQTEHFNPTIKGYEVDMLKLSDILHNKEGDF